jgi:uncharacterized protein YlxW (UPF0749 family)
LKKEYIVIISLILFVTCFLITLQYRTIRQSETEATRLKNENELRDEINEWKDMYEANMYKIQELESKITDYKNAASQNNKTVELLNNEIEDLKILSGLAQLQGGGVIVTLDDTRAINQIASDVGYYDPNVFVIHDSDILAVINELRAAGAEAISINGQRILANTEIRCVGPVIQINGIRLTAPFKISAIGSPDMLAASLKLRGGIVDNLTQSNIDVIIEKTDTIIIPKYDKVLEYKYASPVEEEK